MLARQTFLKSVLVFIALIWVVDAEAAIYKWKDDKGKTFFTDDPTKVPEAYRKKPFINSSSKPKEKEFTVDKVDVPSKKGDIESKKKEGDEKEGLTEAQRSDAEAIRVYLKVAIPRYEKYYKTPASRQKFGVLKAEIAENVPSKKSLFEQVSKHDIPLFQGISGFLKTSIDEDEKTEKLVRPSKYTVKKRTWLIIKRLKSEAEQEKQFLEKLTAALDEKK